MSFFKTVVATAALVTIGASAHAATFDFGAMGDAYESDFAAFAAWDAGNVDPFLEDGGVTLTNITATGPGGKVGYFDDGVKNGLGACTIVASGPDSCDGNPDDNWAAGETITLFFDSVVDLAGLVFGNHTLFGDGSVTINGDIYSVTAGVIDTTGLLAAAAFTFSDPVNAIGDGAYIRAVSVSAIPIPAAGFLLLGGLGGLVAMRRRKS